VTVSTAHTAKGREWPTVQIADDFPPPKDTDQHDDQGRPIPEPVNDTDARLAYVAVTRARQHLDLGGLSWIAAPGCAGPCAAMSWTSCARGACPIVRWKRRARRRGTPGVRPAGFRVGKTGPLADLQLGRAAALVGTPRLMDGQVKRLCIIDSN
jgi:hypothetical protein